MGKLFEDYEVEPLGNFVLLKRHVEEEKTEGGLFVPTQAQEKSLHATVLAVGPGIVVGSTFVKTVVKPGDAVFIDRICGFEIEDGSEKFLVCRETEIIAIVRQK